MDYNAKTKKSLDTIEAAHKEAIRIWTKRANGLCVSTHCPYCELAGATWRGNSEHFAATPNCSLCPANEFWTRDPSVSLPCGKEYYDWADSHSDAQAAAILSIIRKASRKFEVSLQGWYVNGDSDLKYKYLGVHDCGRPVYYCLSHKECEAYPAHRVTDSSIPYNHFEGTIRKATDKEALEAERLMAEQMIRNVSIHELIIRCLKHDNIVRESIAVDEDLRKQRLIENAILAPKLYMVACQPFDRMDFEEAKESARQKALAFGHDYTVVKIVGTQKYKQSTPEVTYEEEGN